MKKLASMSYGRALVLVNLDELVCDMDQQRPIRHQEIARFRKNGGFKGAFFGVPHIDSEKHLIDGHTRIGYLRSMTVDGCYIEAYPEIIPEGRKVGDKCVIECIQVPDGKRAEGFITLNDSDRSKNVEAFKVAVNAKETGFEVEKAVAKLFTKMEIQIQYNTGRVTTPNTTKNAQDLVTHYKKHPKIVENALKLISSVYRHPEDTGIYEYAALTRPFMVALVEVMIEHDTVNYKTLNQAYRVAWQAGLTAETIVKMRQGTGTGSKIKKVRLILEEILNAWLEGRKDGMASVFGYIPRV
jgi:hypothetical protein